MRKIIILISILFFQTIINAQDKDSLLTVIKNYKKQDTILCNRLSLLIDLENDPAIWSKYNEKLGSIALSKIKTVKNKIELNTFYDYYSSYLNNIGLLKSNDGDFDNAITYYKKAIYYNRKSGNYSEFANKYSNIAAAFYLKGNVTKFIDYQNMALSIYYKTKDSANIARTYADIGYVYADNGSENKGVDYFIKSMKLSDKIGNKKYKYRAIEYLIKTLKSQNENIKALEYSNQLIPYFIEIKDEDALALLYFSMASTYNAMGNYKNLISFSFKSIDIAKKIDAQNTIAANYGLLAKYYYNKNILDKAYQYSKLEIDLRKKNLKEPSYSKSMARYVEILIKQNKLNEALVLAIENHKKSLTIDNIEIVLSTARNLKNIYSLKNNKSLALDFAQLEIKIMDSLANINTKNSAIKSLFKYETEKKEDEIKLLSQQKKITELESQRQKSIILIGIISIISLTIISYGLFKRYKTKKQNELLKTKLEETEKTLLAEKKASESELKALKSQMNPHFIFNALNSIQEQFMYGDKVIANEQMGNFTYLTRQILTVSGKKKISLATEVDIITKYLELEKMRFDGDFTYEVKIDDAIDDEYIELPPMLIQPFIENSIKHGLLHKSGNKKVTINFELDTSEEYLICTIEDNGIGRKKSEEIKSKTNHNSFSTASINQRLKLLNENKTSNELLYYQDLFDDQGACIGTKVLLKIYL